jgi:hypothetical protein
MQKKVMRGAQETLKRFRNDLESSQYAHSLDIREYATPPMFATKDMKQQILEMHGKVEFDKGKYHNEKYNDLMKKLVQYRTEFPKIKDVEGRKQIAKEEFDAWFGYLEARREDMPKPEYEIDSKNLGLLRDNFDRFKVMIKALIMNHIL